MRRDCVAAPWWRAGAALATLGVAWGASGDIVDLTSAGASGTVNGAVFQQFVVQPSGTGVINSFVRMQSPGNSGVQQGYNTSGRPAPFDVNTSPQFTRDLTLGEVPLVSFNGANYYEFMLDINEPASGQNGFVSLDDVQIYASSIGGQTTSDLSTLGAAIYSMDMGGDNWVHLNAGLSSGSGISDMRMLIPEAAFTGFDPGTFVYLFSRFGDNFAAQGGFEEWGVAQAIIPLPPAAWIGGVCLVGIGTARYLRARKHRGIA